MKLKKYFDISGELWSGKFYLLGVEPASHNLDDDKDFERKLQKLKIMIIFFVDKGKGLLIKQTTPSEVSKNTGEINADTTANKNTCGESLCPVSMFCQKMNIYS